MAGQCDRKFSHLNLETMTMTANGTSRAELCLIHASCDGAEDNCRDSSGGRPGTGRGMLTADTITRKQIEELRTEAAAAGDFAQVEICDRALDHASRGVDPSPPVEACVDAINAARAMESE